MGAENAYRTFGGPSLENQKCIRVFRRTNDCDQSDYYDRASRIHRRNDGDRFRRGVVYHVVLAGSSWLRLTRCRC